MESGSTMRQRMNKTLDFMKLLLCAHGMILQQHYSVGCSCDCEVKMPSSVDLHVSCSLIDMALVNFERDGLEANRNWLDMFIKDFNDSYQVIHYFFGLHFDVEQCRNWFHGVIAG